MKNRFGNLLKPSPALEPNMNFTDIFIRYNIMIAIGFVAVLTKTPALMIICPFILLEGMMGWCVVHHVLGINHHCES